MSCWRFQMPACSPSPSPSQSPSQSFSSVIFSLSQSLPLSLPLPLRALPLPPSFLYPPLPGPPLPLPGKPPHTRHIKAHMHLLVMLIHVICISLHISAHTIHISAYTFLNDTYACDVHIWQTGSRGSAISLSRTVILCKTRLQQEAGSRHHTCKYMLYICIIFAYTSEYNFFCSYVIMNYSKTCKNPHICTLTFYMQIYALSCTGPESAQSATYNTRMMMINIQVYFVCISSYIGAYAGCNLLSHLTNDNASKCTNLSVT